VSECVCVCVCVCVRVCVLLTFEVAHLAQLLEYQPF
jgi:hypothetical protein